VIICNHDNSHLNDRQTVIECIVVCELTNRKNANCVATLLRNLSPNTSLALIDLAVNTLQGGIYCGFELVVFGDHKFGLPFFQVRDSP